MDKETTSHFANKGENQWIRYDMFPVAYNSRFFMVLTLESDHYFRDQFVFKKNITEIPLVCNG